MKIEILKNVGVNKREYPHKVCFTFKDGKIISKNASNGTTINDIIDRYKTLLFDGYEQDSEVIDKL